MQRPIICLPATIMVTAGMSIAAVAQTTVTLDASADATIYEDFFGDTGNGAGEWLHTGRTASGTFRRFLIRFDLSSIPSGATITDATMSLFCSRTVASGFPVSAHAVTNPWTEGTANAGGNEGGAAPAEAGDVTWVFRSFATDFTGPRWDTLGGDFNTVPSATTIVAGENQFYNWTGADLIADLQAWLDDPASNNGWILIGTEDVGGRTAKRFDSRTNPIEAQRPALTITYTADEPCLADIAEPFGVLDLADIQAFIAAFTTQQRPADVAEPFGVFDLADIQAFIASFNAGCP
jgi:hypothetical protein